jgi:hypothetical protein
MNIDLMELYELVREKFPSLKMELRQNYARIYMAIQHLRLAEHRAFHY